MIDEVKELLTMIQNVPEMVLHVLLGYGIYKVIIFLGTSAGIYGTIRLAINKWHDISVKKLEKPNTVSYEVSGSFINRQDHDNLIMAVRRLKDAMGAHDQRLTYLHSEHVNRAIVAIDNEAIRIKSATTKGN